MSKTPQASRVAIHDSPVHFRAKASLVEAAKELASERGMSLAELMRHALRREIGC
jgi:predicted DNA binding CopG/RHH family protein